MKSNNLKDVTFMIKIRFACFKSVNRIKLIFQANSCSSDVENLLANSAPFSSGKQTKEESEWEANKRKQIRSFFVTGKKVAFYFHLLNFELH
jgi:hypothetical protein